MPEEASSTFEGSLRGYHHLGTMAQRRRCAGGVARRGEMRRRMAPASTEKLLRWRIFFASPQRCEAKRSNHPSTPTGTLPHSDTHTHRISNTQIHNAYPDEPRSPPSLTTFAFASRCR